jgi:hypothetical protein
MIAEPSPFDSMPLSYEKAFGGSDTSHPDPAMHAFEKRNPVGTGYIISGKPEKIADTYLPNLEDPASLIMSWKDKPAPAGFGFLARDWQPRLNYAGTYDESWQRQKCPLLPDDFNELYFNAASPGLIAEPHLIGGEAVKITNAAKDGDIVFRLPHQKLEIDIIIKGKAEIHYPVMDTVIIEPEENRLVLVWRAAISCKRKLLFVEAIRIKSAAGR